MSEVKTIYDCDLDAGMAQLDENMEHFTDVAEQVAASYTQTLDEIMRDIKEQIIDVEEPAIKTIERFFLELTNAVYFIGSNCESADMYASVSKLAQKEAYSKSYLTNALPGYDDKTKKRTAAELDCIATIESLEETALTAITKSAQSKISFKIDAAKEMIRTLSKVLSSRISDTQILGNGKQVLNEVI